MYPKIKVLLGILLLVLTLAACSELPVSWRFQSYTPTSTPTPRPLYLAPPEMECPTTLPSWEGIRPGHSMVTDVVTTLGKPMGIGPNYRGAPSWVYPPILRIPHIPGFDPNIISFREDGHVDWIEMWVMDLDGEFHTVAEYAECYGTTLDRVYRQEKNLHFGQSQIYVWSHCGIALDTVVSGSIRRSEDEWLPIAPQPEIKTNELSFKYSGPSSLSMTVVPDVEELVVRVYLFEPTDYFSFEEFYADFIPLYVDFRIYKQRFSDSETEE